MLFPQWTAELRLEYLVKNEPMTEGSLKKTRFCPVPGIVVMYIEIRTERDRQVWASGSGMNSYDGPCKEFIQSNHRHRSCNLDTLDAEFIISRADLTRVEILGRQKCL